MILAPKFWMVIDVESVGLHGEGFAVGWVVVGYDGVVVEECRLCVSPDDARGTASGREWVEANCPVSAQSLCRSVADLRRTFWSRWREWKGRGAALVADCGWPVEARFLAACVDDRPEVREWEGPYPLHELASILLASGADPLKERDRLPNELPVHDPLADARQSARLLCEAVKRLKSIPSGEIK